MPVRSPTVELHLALSAAACLISLGFAASTHERWLARRQSHELAWTISLVLFALAAGSLWLGTAIGWGPGTFRAFYLLGAVLNVPALACGTVFLLWGRARGRTVAITLAVSGGWATGVLMSSPMRPVADPLVLPQGSDVFGALPRILAAVASGGGATVVFVGAAWSGWRLLRSRGADGRRRAAANALIATGTVVLSGGGVLNSVVDEMTGFAITLVAGISLIFLGFLVATSSSSRSRAWYPNRRVADLL